MWLRLFGARGVDLPLVPSRTTRPSPWYKNGEVSMTEPNGHHTDEIATVMLGGEEYLPPFPAAFVLADWDEESRANHWAAITWWRESEL
jgi:hypothetical protein